MAWIELHQSLWTHRKTVILAAKLDIDEIYAAAHMAKLWTWALDNAPNGDITGLPSRVIAFGAGWKGDADAFLEALISSGWIDQDGEKLNFHDWYEYAGRLIEHRKLQAERAKRKKDLYDNETLIKKVRERDGDNCRYCGKTVNWKDRKSADGGTYDHVDPEGPNTVDNIVVACRGCNSRKGRRTPEQANMKFTDVGRIPTNKSAGNLPEIYPESAITVPNHINDDDDDIYTRAREDKFAQALQNVERAFGAVINPIQAERLGSYIEDGMEPELIEDAAQETRTRGMGIDYFWGILKNCSERGILTRQAFREDQARFEQSKANKARASPKNKLQEANERLIRSIMEAEERERSRGTEVVPHHPKHV